MQGADLGCQPPSVGSALCPLFPPRTNKMAIADPLMGPAARPRRCASLFGLSPDVVQFAEEPPPSLQHFLPEFLWIGASA